MPGGWDWGLFCCAALLAVIGTAFAANGLWALTGPRVTGVVSGRCEVVEGARGGDTTYCPVAFDHEGRARRADVEVSGALATGAGVELAVHGDAVEEVSTARNSLWWSIPLAVAMWSVLFYAGFPQKRVKDA
jgi:hypothetical protein